MDIAIFALAVRARSASPGPGRAFGAPRRIFFVVDRRIIVDEAYERARRLAAKLECAETGVLKTVADELRLLACGGSTALGNERPLVVYSLRGGMYRSEAWARNPLQPIVVASTVDQIGSRLLFRAYGRGAGTWPVYAGLIANDSLILLDEAHCAQPFLQTCRAVGKYREWAEEPLGRCFHPVVMSATPPPAAKCVFRDRSGEGSDPHHPLGQRQMAVKPAALVEPVEAPETEGADRGADELAKRLADVARRQLNGQRRAIVVFANRVATARMAHKLLRDAPAPELESVLLTGRMRAVDREVVGDRLRRLQLHSGQSTGRTLEKPVVVVATQTLEVGADLDFDGLVTECASLDALRQRFGRLNRMGRDIECCAAIVIRANQAEPKRGDEGDPVYGKALTGTWNWLNDNKDANGKVDFGIAAMENLLQELDENTLVALNAPAKSAPVMLPAHVDCWAQTSPEPRPSPDVAPSASSSPGYTKATACEARSVAGATLGVLTSASLAVHAIGQGLAQATGKLGDGSSNRLLSNDGIELERFFGYWVKIVGVRPEVVVALDDELRARRARDAGPMLTGHGRATPLMWRTVLDAEGRYEDELLRALRGVR